MPRGKVVKSNCGTGKRNATRKCRSLTVQQLAPYNPLQN
jgi:hypothetical protein